MATEAQLMEAIQKSVSMAVSAAVQEMMKAGVGGGPTACPKGLTMQQIAEIIVKRQDKFNKDKFADWKFRLEMAARGNSVILANLLKWSEERESQVNHETDISERDKEVNYNLYCILAQLCEGEAFDIVKNVEDQNGAEAYRRLCRRFLGKTRGKRLHLLRKGVNPPKVKKLSEVLGAIEKWEIHVQRLKADFKEELSDGLKVGILLEMIPQDVSDHLAQKIADDDTYIDVKEMVLRYVENKSDADGIAMDISAVNEKEGETDEYDELYYVRGKGKGKGGPCFNCGEQGHLARECPSKGKGKGKDGKGKGGFAGECWVCHEYGHSSRFCPTKGFGKNGEKGKGFSKGYGKNKGSDFGSKGGKGKGWGAYAVYDDYWSGWDYGGHEHLQICGISDFEVVPGEFKPKRMVSNPPGLVQQNRFAALSAEDDDDSDLNLMDDFCPGGACAGERVRERCISGNLRGTSHGARTSVPRGQYPCEGVPSPGCSPHRNGRYHVKNLEGLDFEEAGKDVHREDLQEGVKGVYREDLPEGVKEHFREVGFVEVGALFCPEVEEVNHVKEVKWAKLEAVVDSGAAESVAPSSMAPWLPTKPSEGSRRGQCYLSASGAKLENKGEKRFDMVTAEGNWAEATFQVAEVTRPLCSVTKICDRGNRVVFEAEGGYIQNYATGVKTKFSRQNNVYVMEMFVEEPTGFAGQGA
jgi:hypothetical protein